MGLFVTDIPQLLVRILDDRRALVGVYRRDLLHHGRDLVGIFHHHLIGLRGTQIFKFPQHFLGCPQIQRCLVVRVAEPLSGHDDPAVHLVLRIQEMHVAGGHNRLFELVSQLQDLTV